MPHDPCDWEAPELSAPVDWRHAWAVMTGERRRSWRERLFSWPWRPWQAWEVVVHPLELPTPEAP